MLPNKLPSYTLLIAFALGAIIAYFAAKATTPAYAHQPIATTVIKSDCNTYIVRLHGYKYVNKLLFAEHKCESEAYQPLKEELNNYIENEKRSGKLTAASVYVRIFNSNGEWVCVNPEEQYHPASLLKLPVLFTFARMAEVNPKILDERVLFKEHYAALPTQIYTSKTLQPGHTYTIRELLEYLIAYSDNDALYLLYNYHDPEVYKKIFTDLEIPFPEENRDDAGIKVKEYSTLLRVLYNSTYLSTQSSEFALSLLVKSDFKEGLLKGIPPSVDVAHKFGEYYSGNAFELHESGIVYAKDHHYIITVMTKGTDMKELSEVMGNLSRSTYDYLIENKQP